MKFYAFEHCYGARVRDEDGDPLGAVHTFNSKRRRNEWLNDNTAEIWERGYREKMPARQAKVYMWRGWFWVTHPEK